MEVELKLAGNPDELKKLPRHPALRALFTGRAANIQQVTTYFDTPDGALRAQGLDLRVRRAGRRWMQCLKSRAHGAAGPAREYESALRSAQPDAEAIVDADLRAMVGAVMAQQSFGAIFETRIKRSARRLKTRDGAEIELAIDLGSIHAQGREIPVAEAELELKSGRADGLYAVAIELAETAPLQIETETKSDRGYRLYAGEGLSASRAPHVVLEPQASVEEAWCRILEAGLTHLVRNAKVFLNSRPPESVHQMRVAIRRLRAAFSAFRPLVESPESGGLRETLRELAKTLGTARDLDVFAAEALHPLIQALGHDPRLDLLAQSITRAQTRAYAEALRVLSSPAYARLILDLRRFIDGRIWRRNDAIALSELEAPVLAFARSTLDRRYKKALKIGRHLSLLQGDDRHQMRIELKKLRYAGDFFESLFSRKSAKAYLGHMAELQDRLGFLNDTEVGDALVQHLIQNAPVKQRPDLAFAGGLVIGWKSERAQREWNKVIKLWPEFVKRPVFWK